MLHCKNISSTVSTALQLVKETLWNLVLYFIYFFTLLFWIRFIGVSAQGNRGVVINNQKFDDSSGIQYAQTHQSSTIQPPIIRFTTTTQVNISCENVSKISEKSVERQNRKSIELYFVSTTTMSPVLIIHLFFAGADSCDFQTQNSFNYSICAGNTKTIPFNHSICSPSTKNHPTTILESIQRGRKMDEFTNYESSSQKRTRTTKNQHLVWH